MEKFKNRITHEFVGLKTGILIAGLLLTELAASGSLKGASGSFFGWLSEVSDATPWPRIFISDNENRITFYTQTLINRDGRYTDERQWLSLLDSNGCLNIEMAKQKYDFGREEPDLKQPFDVNAWFCGDN